MILCTPELSDAVTKNLIKLSEYLVAEGLISQGAATDLRNERNSESSRAAQLVDLIQSEVKGLQGHQNYKKFINTLEKGGKKYYSDILSILGTAFYYSILCSINTRTYACMCVLRPS